MAVPQAKAIIAAFRERCATERSCDGRENDGLHLGKSGDYTTKNRHFVCCFCKGDIGSHRFIEHLAGKKGEVKSCDKVLGSVREGQPIRSHGQNADP